MDNQVPQDVVKQRFNRLLEEVQNISSEKTKKDVGVVVEVLVEEPNEQDASLVTGRTSQNYIVHFKGDTSLIGQIVKVRLDESKGFYYMGTMV